MKYPNRKPSFRIVTLSVMVSLLFFLMLQSASVNQVKTIPIDREMVIKVSLDSMAEKLGIDYKSDVNYEDRQTERYAFLIQDVRWPRVVMAGLIGAALGLAGGAIQGIFRNPLAEPGLIGVASGAAVGAVTAIWLRLDLSNILESLPRIVIDPSELAGLKLGQTLLGFGVGLIVTLLVYRLSRFGGRTDTTNLLLVGFAVNAIAGAYIGIAVIVGAGGRDTDIIFWSLGSVKDITWQDVYIVLPFVLLGSIILPLIARQLNILTLGEEEARNLGVNTEFIRRIAITVSALLVGIAVGFVGIINFIGLVVPHVMRFLFGPDHRIVLPASIIGGAIFLIAADMFARTLPGGPSADTGITVEVPVGVLTALVGGPFFLFLILLTQSQRKQS